MKNAIRVLIVMLSLSGGLSAQFYDPPFHMSPYTKNDVLDSANLKITYKLTYTKNPESPDIKDTDIEVLLIGNNFSKYYSSLYMEYCKDIYDGLKKGKYNFIPNPSEGVLSIEILKNKDKNELTCTELQTALHKSFLYIEQIPKINWVIGSESKQIASYPCFKATAEFRGRSYEAWFTPGIPVNNGPWKFGGLPGLILKVTDTKLEYDFECVGIENLKKREPIVLYKLKYEHTTRDKYLQLCERYHRDIVPYFKAQGGAAFNLKSRSDPGVDKEYKSLKRPYNPLELK